MPTKIRVRATTLSVLLLVASLAAPARADRAEALYKEGMAYKNQGKIDEAIAAFEKAVAERPNHVMAWSSLGTLYKKKEQYDKAVAAYEKATELSPKTAVLWANLGYVYARANRADDAIVALLKSCRIDHKDAAMHAFLGTLFRQKGNIKGAIVHLKWAVKLKADDPDYYNNLGVALRHDKQYPKAIEAFTRGIEADPKSYKCLTSRGMQYHLLKDLQKARADYDAALTHNPRYFNARLNRGALMTKVEGPAAALQEFNQMLLDFPQRYEIYGMRGRTLVNLGKLKEAEADLERAIQMGDPDPETRKVLELVRRNMK